MSLADAAPSETSLEDRRYVEVNNPTVTLNGDYETYLADLRDGTSINLKLSPLVPTDPNPDITKARLAETVREGDVLRVKGSDGTILPVLEFMADRSAPADLVLMTEPVGNAKNNHKAFVPRDLWLRPSEVIKNGSISVVYPLRTAIAQPEDEEEELPAERAVKLALAITDIGGVATGAQYLNASGVRTERQFIKRHVSRFLGERAAELATLGYDAWISLDALPEIGVVHFDEHPNGLKSSIAEVFANARDVAKIARFNDADIFELGFEYGTVPPGLFSKMHAIWHLLRINGDLLTETIGVRQPRKSLHFKLAEGASADIDHDGDSTRVRGGTTVDVDQVADNDPTHRPISVVTAWELAA